MPQLPSYTSRDVTGPARITISVRHNLTFCMAMPYIETMKDARASGKIRGGDMAMDQIFGGRIYDPFFSESRSAAFLGAP